MTQGEIIILGLLKRKDRYGYEIEKHIESNHMRVWTRIGFSSIYNILNKLHKKKLIDYRYEEEKDGPRKKVFFILDEGKEAFNTTLVEMLRNPMKPKQDIDVAIVFSLLIEPEQVRSALIEHREELENRIERHKSLFNKRFSDKKTVGMLFRRAILHMETDIRWIDEVLEN